MRKLAYLLILPGLAVMAWGGIGIVRHREAAHREEERGRRELREWQRQIASELHPTRQAEWERTATDSPEKLLRACTVAEPADEGPGDE